jgi:energy-coupling factor transport system ATP-binding protein|uniref:ATP-binding cassette domain-containing protein n=1 Tax=Mesoaciditoga lauensis TaxID=1495039 RepID=A0A7V3VT83_9BACT
MIKFEGSYFNYENLQILEDMNLEIGEGEFVAVLGLNGTGKTSMFKLMNGLLLPTKGKVEVDGVDTKDEDKIWEVRRNVGIVFQNPESQIVGTTVEEDVAFGLENLGVPRPEMIERIKEALEFVGLDRFKNMEPHRLSGGQKQLLCVADILSMRPKYIVMDEPTSMMDPMSRETILKMLVKLHGIGHTIIFSTHLVDEIVFAQRIIYLRNGKVAFDGRPVDVVEMIRDEFGSSEFVDFQMDLFKKGIIDRLFDVEELAERLVKFCR